MNYNFTKNNKICLTTCVKLETLNTMTYEGVLTKMQTEFGDPIQYYLVFENRHNYMHLQHYHQLEDKKVLHKLLLVNIF